MRLSKLIILLLVLFLIIIGFKVFSKNQNITENLVSPETPKPTGVNISPKLNVFSIQAWVYPGAPSCKAMEEIADGRKIDVLKTGYFTIDEIGELTLLTEESYGCNGFSLDNVANIQKYSTQQFVVVSSNHIDMRVLFADSNKANDAINKLVDFVVKHNFSGVEIDFEEFSSWITFDYENYKKFVFSLAQVLHAKQKLLMVDGPVITSTTQKDYQWKYSDFDKSPVDYILLMAYDNQYDGGEGSFISPNEWVRETVRYVLDQVDKTKLVVGVPSYGYHSNSENQIVLDTREQSIKFPGSQKAKQSDLSFEYSWWEKGNFYVMQNKDGLAKKVELIRSLGVQNISIWHLGGNSWFE